MIKLLHVFRVEKFSIEFEENTIRRTYVGLQNSCWRLILGNGLTPHIAAIKNK